MSFLHTIIYLPIFNSLMWLEKVLPGHDLGLAIIIVTLVIRLILYVPTLSAIRSSRQMQSLQPRLKELQAKYKDDKETLAREQMKLYKESKVNPASSCLPMIIQLVVFYYLYTVFLNGIKIDEQGLLHPDQIKNLYAGLQPYFQTHVINTHLFSFLDLTKSGNYVLALLTAAAQFWQTKMLAAPKEPNVPGAKDESMLAATNRSMTYTLPLIIGFIVYRAPAGLGLYWLVTALFSIVQQYFFLRQHPLVPPTTPSDSTPALNPPNATS